MLLGLAYEIPLWVPVLVGGGLPNATVYPRGHPRNKDAVSGSRKRISGDKSNSPTVSTIQKGVPLKR